MYTHARGFPGGSVILKKTTTTKKTHKNLARQTGDAGDKGSTTGSGRSPGERNDNPPQYSRLGNIRDGGAWRAAVHEVTKSQT